MPAVPKMILRCSLRNYNDIYMDAKRFTEQCSCCQAVT